MTQSQQGLEAQLATRAKASGWSDSQAQWIGRLGAEVLQGQPASSPAALEAAYKAAERQLSVGYFNNAVEQGKSRLVAFLTVIDLEKQVIVRAGGTAPAYSDDALKTAYAALEGAASRGAPVEEQIAVAFTALRQSTPPAP